MELVNRFSVSPSAVDLTDLGIVKRKLSKRDNFSSFLAASKQIRKVSDKNSPRKIFLSQNLKQRADSIFVTGRKKSEIFKITRMPRRSETESVLS